MRDAALLGGNDLPNAALLTANRCASEAKASLSAAAIEVVVVRLVECEVN